MAKVTENIILGAAQVYLSDVGDAVPSPASSASMTAAADADGNWNNVGFTSEGLDISFEPEYTDVQVDQILDSAALFKTSQRVTIATSFTEATLENLAFVLGQPGSSVSGNAPAAAGDSKSIEIQGGSLGAEPEERGFLAVGPGPRVAPTGTWTTGPFYERIYFNARVISTETVGTGVKRNEATMFPVTFRCLPDAAATGQEYGTITDRVYGVSA